MKPLPIFKFLLIGSVLPLLVSAATTAYAANPGLTAMPQELEVRFALSALPPHLRSDATVYVLDPAIGYKLVDKGASGIECLVERTAWELGTDRDDIYIPLCYDAAGINGHFKAIKDAAAMRAKGMSAAAIKLAIAKRWKQDFYRVPSRAGLSYMVSPIMRTKSSPDFKVIKDHPDLDVKTMVMPHMMIYASGVTNADIGAKPDFTHPDTLSDPFIDFQGNNQQSYMIQPVGEAEKARILENEKPLIDALCNYRDVLCLDNMGKMDH